MKYPILAVLFFISSFSFAQNEKEDILSFQNILNTDYMDSLHSPLSKEKRLIFKGHDFYPIDLTYRVTAAFLRTPNEKPFKMTTTKGEARDYLKYGEVSFSINGKNMKLNVYQSLDLIKLEAYKNYLFLPFKDLTNSVETYGGGRFIDLTIPAGKTIVCDFNKAYNPYCAYSDRFSCPITPIENTLPVQIKAGVKAPTEH
ncbi:MAG: DUF1684 domain-containing protein [Bacteroidota bacterium]